MVTKVEKLNTRQQQLIDELALGSSEQDILFEILELEREMTLREER